MKPSIVAGALALALSPGAASAEPVERAKVEAALPQIEAMAAKLVADGAVPGIAIVVVHADEAVYLGGFGLREVGKPETVDADTVFQLASMSKPISATVVAKLVSDDVLGWDSRIADLNPAFQLHDPFPTAEVTVTDLLNHRSGLPGTSGDDLEAIGFDRETIAARLRLVPPSSSFRAGYAYSNAGFTQGRARRGDADRAVLGGGRRGAALPAARHGRHQLAALRLRGAPQPGDAARPLAGRLGRARHARARRAGAGRRRQRLGARPRAVAAA